MKQGHCKSVFAPRAIVLAVAGCFSAGLSLANPVGPSVVSGSATFATQGNVLTVTNSAGAVINWQGFSIGSSEVTRFIQPSAASSVLNRVVTADPSILLGTLQSNGRVFLINPAGILVGAGAVVDTAGFVASTLNLSNSDFAAGKLNFTATPGAGTVRNDGTITTPSGGSVYLVGAQVENHGIINTPNGETLLAAGQTVQLVDTATPGVRVEITADKEQALNLGQLLAESGRIGVVGAAVRNSGRISASSVTQAGGRIFLTATRGVTVDGSGSVEATGVTGGQADILGNAVVLADSARIDVSGTQGGGTIRVGGDAQGKGTDVQNALTTTVGSDVVLKADALTQGKGGKVVVWADEATHMNGSISARGGSESGDGGFVETSGRTIDFYGARVDASATRGQAGSWLIDPDSLSIDSTGAIALVTALDTGTSGTNVHLYNNTSAYGSVTGDGLGRISVCSPVSWTKASELWLDATTSIGINAAISNSNAGGRLRLDAGAGGITQDGSSTISVANLLAKSAGSVSLPALSVDMLAATVSGGGATFNNDKDLIIGAYTPTDGGAAINGVTTTGSGSLAISAGANRLTVDRAISSADYITLTAGTLTDNATVTSSSGVVSLLADRIELNAPVGATYSVDAGTVTIAPRTTSQTVELGGNAKNASGAVLSLTQGELQRIRTGTLRIGNNPSSSGVGSLTVVGDLDLTTGGLSQALWLNSWYSTNASNVVTVNGVVSVPNYFYATAGTFTNNAVVRTASAFGTSINITADKIALNAPSGATYSLDAGAYGSVSLKPVSGASSIELGGTSKNLSAGVLSLTQDELRRVRANGLSVGSNAYETGDGSITVVGDLDLTSGGLISSFINNSMQMGFSLNTGSHGSVTVNGNVTVPYSFAASTGTFTNNAVVRAAGNDSVSTDYRSVWISADKVNLNAPGSGAQYSLDAGTGGSVNITPYAYTSGQTIELGGVGKNAATGVLSLTLPEILRIHGRNLSIGSYYNGVASNIGNLTVLGDLDLTTGSLGYGLSLAANGSGSILIDPAVTKIAAPGELNFYAQSFTNNAADLKALGTGGKSPSISIVADSVSLGTGVIQTGSGGSVDFLPMTSTRNIQVGGAYTNDALSLTEADLQMLAANNTYVSVSSANMSGNLVLGGSLDLSGTQASVALVSGGSLNVDYTITTPNALLLGARNGAVSQAASAKVTTPYLVALATTGIALDGTVNKVKRLTMQTTTGSIAFRNEAYDGEAKLVIQPVSTLCSNYDVDCYSLTDYYSGVITKYLSIGRTGFPVASYTAGIMTGNGTISLSNQGSIALAAPVVTNTASSDAVVSLEATGTGATITGTGTSADVIGYRLDAMAAGGIGSAATPLWSQVSYLSADGGSGNLYAVNSGALTTQGISAASDISVTAKSPLTIASSGVTSTGNGTITLVAGATSSTATTDVLTIDAPVTTTGTINLRAGNGITGSQVPNTSNVVAVANLNTTPTTEATIASTVATTVQTTQTQTVSTLTTSESKTGSSSTSSVIAAASYTAPAVQTTTTTTAATPLPTQTLSGGVVGGESANSFGSSSSDSGSGGSGTTTAGSSGSSSGSSGSSSSSQSGQSSGGSSSSGDQKNAKGKTGYGQCVLR